MKTVLILITLCAVSCFNPSILPAQSPRTGKAEVKQYRSKNFVVYTDLSPEETKELLERLETMLKLMSRYWGAPSRKIIEMYVFDDLDNWDSSKVPADAWQSVRGGGGLTMSQTLNQVSAFSNQSRIVDAKAIVYADSRRGTPQHEAVHAYCAQTFGRTGPTWYSEGMAEVGNYWKGVDDKSVTCDDFICRYLRETPPKPLRELVDPNQVTGDSWQNYAQRWALCHLLGFNENYTRRFKPLGLALLQGNRRVSFGSVYGGMFEEIEFEYQQFVKHVVPGYRVDLCSWDWKTKFSTPRSSTKLVSKIDANHGWQATRLEVRQGESYDYSASGEWSIDPEAETKLTADGNEAGEGKLIGVLFEDYELSEPFELGAEGTFEAPQDGKLYVRCREAWESIEDNKGTLTLRMSLSK